MNITPSIEANYLLQYKAHEPSTSSAQRFMCHF